VLLRSLSHKILWPTKIKTIFKYAESREQRKTLLQKKSVGLRKIPF
jgi:hypothetical protein